MNSFAGSEQKLVFLGNHSLISIGCLPFIFSFCSPLEKQVWMSVSHLLANIHVMVYSRGESWDRIIGQRRSPQCFQILDIINFNTEIWPLISVIFEVHCTAFSLSPTCSLCSKNILPVWYTWYHTYSSSCVAASQAILRIIYMNYECEFKNCKHWSKNYSNKLFLIPTNPAIQLYSCM